MSIDPGRPVGERVAERISRARLFDDLGIDFCCHGETPLEAACRQFGLSVAAVVADIERLDAEPPRPDEPDDRAMPLEQLADPIEATHHVFMKQELPCRGPSTRSSFFLGD